MKEWQMNERANAFKYARRTKQTYQMPTNRPNKENMQIDKRENFVKEINKQIDENFLPLTFPKLVWKKQCLQLNKEKIL